MRFPVIWAVFAVAVGAPSLRVTFSCFDRFVRFPRFSQLFFPRLCCANVSGSRFHDVGQFSPGSRFSQFRPFRQLYLPRFGRANVVRITFLRRRTAFSGFTFFPVSAVPVAVFPSFCCANVSGSRFSDVGQFSPGSRFSQCRPFRQLFSHVSAVQTCPGHVSTMSDSFLRVHVFPSFGRSGRCFFQRYCCANVSGSSLSYVGQFSPGSRFCPFRPFRQPFSHVSAVYTCSGHVPPMSGIFYGFTFFPVSAVPAAVFPTFMLCKRVRVTFPRCRTVFSGFTFFPVSAVPAAVFTTFRPCERCPGHVSPMSDSFLRVHVFPSFGRSGRCFPTFLPYKRVRVTFPRCRTVFSGFTFLPVLAVPAAVFTTFLPFKRVRATFPRCRALLSSFTFFARFGCSRGRFPTFLSCIRVWVTFPRCRAVFPGITVFPTFPRCPRSRSQHFRNVLKFRSISIVSCI
jgi:hypothetical protein